MTEKQTILYNQLSKEFELTRPQMGTLIWQYRMGRRGKYFFKEAARFDKINKRPVYIYSLDVDEVPVYIGRTLDIKKRVWMHRRCVREATAHNREINRKNKKRKNKLYPRTDMYAKLPINFTSSIIDTVSQKDWIFWEKFYISLFKTFGFKLLNTRPGGI